MKISVFGLGYVGTVSAVCLADSGHEVIGVDPNETKVKLINAGTPPIIEQDIGALIEKSVNNGQLQATTAVQHPVQWSDVSLICVGTPSQLNGNLDLRFIRSVCEEVGEALKEKDRYHVVVIRSTMLPGSMETVVIPTLQDASGKRAGQDFGVCVNPEFLREGSAVHDYYHPPKTVIGATDKRSATVVAKLYECLEAPLIETDVRSAEMVKYTDNVWHALKIGFANEIGNLCKSLDLDGQQVMSYFCQDTKLNLSPYYLKPGFAFGGSCLPKDLRALTYKARTLDLNLPILNSILPSNQQQIDRSLQLIMNKGKKRVGILGFSFKAGTDDMRESPMVEIIERLLGKGYDIRIFDKNVNIAKLMGANKDYILNQIPHISQLMVNSLEEIILHSEVLVIGNNEKDFQRIFSLIKEGQVIVDLVRIAPEPSSSNQYDGICW